MHDHLPIETQRFKQLRQEFNLTQIAFSEALNIKGSLADIERGKTRLSGATIAKLLQVYHVNPLWMFGESQQKFLYESESVLPKVITLDSDKNENIALVNVKASAGYAHNLQDTEWYESLPAFSLPLPEYRNASFRAFQVQGDSMLPSLQPGEWVIARAEEKLAHVTNGHIYVVVLADTVVVKKVVKTTKGVQLISLNTIYPVIETTSAEVMEIWKVTAKITSHLDQPAGSIEDLTREMREGFVSLKSLLSSTNK
ncbi:LexA family transcriptional regulator [Flavobacterium silvaticum]|uniref:Helix-turn-helix domain-containing protein n=1 Tax=Flavobacterium silvaticum TaxID=1852020 RepID=A0A972FWK9_9FLAO|nr:LexA family transcriptional regulator [Flavobacterium silvaticum]NMH29347.1 helix-turn-helix domain-containing protein [Flavobacterium silvaticum]